MDKGYKATPWLAIALRQSRVSVRELAERIGYSKSYLYNLRAGRVACRRLVGERLATELNLDFDVLFVVSSDKEDAQ